MKRNKWKGWNGYTALFIYAVIVVAIIVVVSSILIGMGVQIWPPRAK